MKINELYTALPAITAISLNYYNAFVQTGGNTITPTQRGVAVRYETDGIVNTIKNVVVSETGVVLDTLYFQFAEYLRDVLAYCPDSLFTYETLTAAQATYVEFMFSSIQSTLTPGVITATPKGVKSMKTPVGSQFELFEDAETGSQNAELLGPLINIVGSTLCGTAITSLGSLLPLFSAYGLRVEQAELETIIDVATPTNLYTY